MSNLADVIEAFILRKLSGEASDIIILKRNEMAEEIACAPSQISYVLSTRFTSERGFIVESRRGSGGFVRIARIAADGGEAGAMADQAVNEEVGAVLARMRDNGLLSQREAAIMAHFFAIIADKFYPQERRAILRALLMTLAKHS